ncbi:hypothetical protein H920_07035 [Fukomys damarensis]|uniref:Uncharacterized protein n=1 Tax=Fukomys damarensis TaxID=885580 RepID=A0A091E8M1_FUKDA|nr:hypothetical protein H920_07035 [Fukomys damarensis]
MGVLQFTPNDDLEEKTGSPGEHGRASDARLMRPRGHAVDDRDLWGDQPQPPCRVLLTATSSAVCVGLPEEGCWRCTVGCTDAAIPEHEMPSRVLVIHCPLPFLLASGFVILSFPA